VRGLADTEAFDLSLPLSAIIMFSAVMAQSALPQSTAASGQKHIESIHG